MPLAIRELNWDDWNVEHIARHGVSALEVEQVCFSDETQYSKAGRQRYQAIGQTDAGRYLTVFLDREGPGRYYIVTARPSDERERRTYRDRRR